MGDAQPCRIRFSTIDSMQLIKDLIKEWQKSTEQKPFFIPKTQQHAVPPILAWLAKQMAQFKKISAPQPNPLGEWEKQGSTGASRRRMLRLWRYETLGENSDQRLS